MMKMAMVTFVIVLIFAGCSSGVTSSTITDSRTNTMRLIWSITRRLRLAEGISYTSKILKLKRIWVSTVFLE